MKKRKIGVAIAVLLFELSAVAATVSTPTYFWVDYTTNTIKSGKIPPLGIQTYATKLEADGYLFRYWVNSSNSVVTGYKKDAPIGDMVYTKLDGAKEFAQMGGHSIIDLSPVLARGYRGAGVTVAVIDSGIDASNSELSGKVNTGKSWDYVTNTKPAAGSAADPNGHGTHVAGIIAGKLDGVGFHGVAPSAKLLSYRTLNAAGGGSLSDTVLMDPVDKGMTAGARIFSNSWGVQNRADGSNIVGPAAMARYKSAVASDAVFVFANGNSGLSQPQTMAGLPRFDADLQKGWVAVASLDPSTRVIAAYSDRCGVTADWCITAPGSNIVSARSGGGSTLKSGTSMATPYVSGSIALLKSQFTTLSYQDIVQRIFYTADKSGAYADKSVYGNGVLNVAGASNPIGGLWVPLSGTIYGKATNLGSLILDANASSTSAAGLLMQLNATKLLVVDGYQRAPFKAKASELVQVVQGSADPLNWGAQSVRFSSDVASVPRSGFAMGFHGSPAGLDRPSMTMGFAGERSSLGFATQMTPAALDFSALREQGVSMSEFVRGGNPLTQELITGGTYSAQLGTGLRLNTTAFSGERERMNVRMGLEAQVGESTTLGLESTYAKGGSPSLGFDFAVDKPEALSTQYMAYAKQKVGDELTLMGGVSLKKMIDDAERSGLAVSQTERANALVLGASWAATNRSNVGIALRSEMGVRSSYSMRLPVDVRDNGDVVFKSFNFSAASAPVNSVGLFWDAKLGKGQLAASLLKTGSQSQGYVGYRLSY